MCVLGGVQEGCFNDFMFLKKQNHNNRREEGILNMNFAFDLGGMKVGREGCMICFAPPYIIFLSQAMRFVTTL